jgi:DUF1009 family protein
MAAKLAVLAGRGPLPGAVIRAAQARGQEVFVLAFEGETDPELVTDLPHAWVGLGSVGRSIRLLHQAAVDEVVMIGPVRRPSLANLKLDLRGAQLLAKVGLKGGQGDDRILSTIVRELEGEGFRVLGADQVVGPLLAPEGGLTRCTPDETARLDIAHGIEVAKALGALDVGQAVVVQQGLVLGVEAVEGTDALLARVADLRREGPGGVLVKLKKPEQERRADLPTIGPGTVEGAHRAGLQGLAIHAGNCLIVDQPATVAAADAAGLFITAIDPAG